MSGDYYARLGWRLPAPGDFRARVQAARDATVPADSTWRQLAQFALTEPQLHQLGRAFAAHRARIGIDTLTPFRLALLSNATAEHLIPALVASALRYGVALDVLCISYEAALVAAMGGDARLSAFAPDAVLLALDHRALPLDVSPGEAARTASAAAIAQWRAWHDGLARAGFFTLAQTIAPPPKRRFGHADRAIDGTPSRLVAEVNDEIVQHATAVLDIAALVETVGSSNWFDERRHHEAKLPFALPYVPLYADHVARVIGAIRGKSRRVLVLDLDNTLWGGIVGDDGVEGIVIGNGTARGEAHLALQQEARALRARGVLLAVCSKNDDAIARRVFEERRDMPLELGAFAAFHANWSDKAANLVAIAESLSLGLDSLVFLDDNPAERELVRSLLPDVAVPELPDDPSGYVRAVDAGGWFEAITFSEEDRRRADLYANRQAMMQLAPNDLGAYLASLRMELEVSPISAANRERVVQLINKSNQFNLTTRRYTEAEVSALEGDVTRPAIVARLRDRLDDHGIISVILGDVAHGVLQLPLWVMSCRVIGRGVERAILGAIVREAARQGCLSIEGRFVPTPRNTLVVDHYRTLGFQQICTDADGSSTWRLALGDWQNADAPPIEVIDGALSPRAGG